jgi:hypothetical protein
MFVVLVGCDHVRGGTHLEDASTYLKKEMKKLQGRD